MTTVTSRDLNFIQALELKVEAQVPDTANMERDLYTELSVWKATHPNSVVHVTTYDAGTHYPRGWYKLEPNERIMNELGLGKNPVNQPTEWATLTVYYETAPE